MSQVVYTGDEDGKVVSLDIELQRD
jgi:hypothetical protein